MTIEIRKPLPEERFAFVQRAEAIYVASFPANERKSMQKYETICAQENAFCPALLYHDGDLCGLMFYWVTEEFTYLEHFALDPQYRNKGFGGKALDLFLSEHPKPILEVEPPRSDITCRRIEFYGRHGLRLVDFKFIHPGYEEGTEPYVLCLMAKRKWGRERCIRFVDWLVDNVLHIACAS